MFSLQHIIWLVICAAIVAVSLIQYKKRKPSLSQVLNICCVICLLSETIKVFSTLEMVSSADGSIIFPYIPMNHLPLHLCSIQILFVFYVRFTGNKKMRENLLSFMYPSCLLGALSALAMPSIFSTTISVNQAFTHPMAYQFFIYHSMLVALGLIIALSGEIRWEWKHYFQCIIIITLMGFLSIYVNSIFAKATYLDGVLQHVDFWPNFFFTYNNPLGIKVTTITGWRIYLVILIAVVYLLSLVCYYPLIRKNAKK